jgi:hypothetical protein
MSLTARQLKCPTLPTKFGGPWAQGRTRGSHNQHGDQHCPCAGVQELGFGGSDLVRGAAPRASRFLDVIRHGRRSKLDDLPTEGGVALAMQNLPLRLDMRLY